MSEEQNTLEAGVTFSDLVLSIATNAVAHMGGDDTQDERVPSRADLQVASNHIDMLEMLKIKTKGNLDVEEENLLGALLYELRMKYLDVARSA